MAKRKAGRKKNPPKGKSKLAPLVFGLVIATVLTGVYFATKPAADVQPVAPATGFLIETRPVLSSAFFTGRVAQAYKIAAEIPKILDSQFCYCYCKKEKGHKTLLTCYTNRHASKCDICLGETLYAYELYKQGLTLDEIVIAVEKKFYRPIPNRRNL
ncbi:MAG: CYCXC family (seleno)protein [Nitrospinaceae bacterium]